MATVTLPSREVLEQQDREAWERYASACWDPEATAEDREKAFALALDSLKMLLDCERRRL